MNLSDRVSAFLFRHGIRGSTRFHQAVCRGKRIAVRTKHGVVLSVDPHEYVDGFVLRHGYYEEEVLTAITDNLAPGDLFWDVGSNLGLHALTVARLRRDVRICAFEPNPVMAGLIRAAAAANRAGIDVLELALDSQAGVAEFYLHPGNAGRSGLHNWASDPTLRHIEVVTARGDDLVAQARALAPNVIKIDVEGNEARVLEGMPVLCADHRLHTVIFEDSVIESTAAKQRLRAAGFEIHALARREATHHDLENFLARRKPARLPGGDQASG